MTTQTAPPRRPPPGAPSRPPRPPENRHEAHQAIVASIGEDPDAWLAELQSAILDLNDARLALAAHKAQMAALESEWGSIGNLPSLFDHTRKQLLASLIERRRQQLEDRQAAEIEAEKKVSTKIVEAALDTWARAHEEYKSFLTEARSHRREYETMRAELDRLWTEVHRCEGMKEYITARVRMTEEKIRHSRALANLAR